MAKNKDAHHDEHRPDVAKYVKVFGALMVLTLITVVISKFHLPRPQAIALGLFVATIKATLVCGIFMHLWGESKVIHKALYITLACAVILVLPMIDFTMITHKMTSPVDVASQHPHEGAEAEKATEPIKVEPVSPPATVLPKKKAAKGH
jgi:caa(3)-type oxidase subunit IV